MNYIKGKVRQLIFESDSGYKVGIIRIKESNDSELEEFVNKTITFVGYFANLTFEDTYVFEGELVYNDRYGYQYKVNNYSREEIKGRDALLEFLSSPLIKGVGEKLAVKIVDTLGDDALDKIKSNYDNLLLVPGITEKKALKIYDSILKYSTTDDIIVSLKQMGFSINDSLQIINRFDDRAVSMVKENPYVLKDIIDFKKLDSIYLSLDSYDDNIRIKYCVLECFNYLEMSSGNTYFSLEEILDGINTYFKIIISLDELSEYIDNLEKEYYIVNEKDKYFLKDTYENELYIAYKLDKINSLPIKPIKTFDSEIKKLQEDIGVTYNEEQLSAIKNALSSRVSIITGGPGTGKTTIVNAICNMYILLNNISNVGISSNIALLAPTGRASKKLAEATHLGSSTIHRYLKWNREADDFGVNEFNPNYHKLIIIDETSMIDNNLFASLLRGITDNVQLVLVGDANQLPSVGPGLILNDLIQSNLYSFNPLYQIYRQSSNSYIPILASEIKDKCLSNSYMSVHDDYNFLKVDSSRIKDAIKKICELSINKGLTDKDIQILIPMYKGENGIDNINMLLQELFNPKSDDKKEAKVLNVTFREHDKVIQLVNDPDNGVFNGDIGYITHIFTINHPKKKTVFTIDFDGIKVDYNKEDLNQIKHAYAMTIHKAQGSEFKHVIMPVTKNYYKMLYNKLIYTGVSRAKKSLVIIGEDIAFKMAVNNDYSQKRNTDLLNKLLNNK